MSTLLTAQQVTLRPDNQLLLDNINITLKKGDRIGLIGFNGCGKSTLLSVLSQRTAPQQGKVALANNCLMASIEQYLPTELQHASLLDSLLALLPANERLERQWQAQALLAEVGFDVSQFNQHSDSLSGGEHTRLLLARALLLQPDLLLLDEPSNHLDLPTTLWLETFLKQWRGSFVLVSHDRRLLDNVTNCSWIMRDQRLHHFQLPCSQALIALEEQDRAAEHCRESQQKEVDRIEASAKQKAQWGKVYDNEDFARTAKHMFKRAERLKEQMLDKPQQSPWQIELQTQALPANRLLALSDYPVFAGASDHLLYRVGDLQLKSGDRVAILGANGCGKSSMLSQIWQQFQNTETPIDNGLTLHSLCQIGLYDQEQQQLCGSDTLPEALRRFAEASQQTIKMALIRAGFSYPDHQKCVANLSGGERARLLLAGLNLSQRQLLLLDEPTNHLDLQGKQQLSQAISQTHGAVMLVSHDREFIETSCNRFWVIVDKQIQEALTTEQAYGLLGQPQSTTASPSRDQVNDCSGLDSKTDAAAPSAEEEMLEQLLLLEQRLEADLNRKSRHQKPALQAQWRRQIAQLSAQLGLV